MFKRYAQIESILADHVAAVVVLGLASGPLRFGELADIVVGSCPGRPSDLRLTRSLARLVSFGAVRQVDRADGRVYVLTSSGERLARDIRRVTEVLTASG